MEQETTSRGVWRPGTPIEQSHYFWDGPPRVVRDGAGDTGLTMVDLFSGAGGFAEGMTQAGFTTVLATDIHPPSLRTFGENHASSALILGDMRKTPNAMILSALEKRQVHLVTAGVPCQGFSLSNRKRWADDPRNFLFREFVRVIDLLMPEAVVLENVSGIRSAAGGAFVEAISNAMAEHGYEVQHRLLNAADYGVPQQRLRYFFVGVRRGLSWEWPEPTHGTDRNRHVTVWEAIGDLPQIGPGEEADEYDKEPWTAYQVEMRVGSTQLWNHVAPQHDPDVVAKIAQTSPGEPIYPRFRQRIRLHPDRVSPTQVSGGIRPQYQFGHPRLPRGLTVRERARIQSFPDRYSFSGGTVQGRVQTGQAVPPKVAAAIGHQLARTLGKSREQSALSAST